MHLGHKITLASRRGGGAAFGVTITGLTSGEARIGDHASISYTTDPVSATETVKWSNSSNPADAATYGTGANPTDYTAGDEGLLWLHVTDGGETVSRSAPIRYAPGTASSIVDGQTATVDDTVLSIAATASGANLTFTYSLLNAPAGMTTNASAGGIGGTVTEVFSGTVTLRATDQYGRVLDDTFTFTSSLRTAATAAGALADQNWTVDDDTVDLSLVSDFTANGNTLTYAITGLPTGLVDDGDGTISGTPTVNGQSGTITITATDEYSRQVSSAFSYTTAYRAQATGGADLDLLFVVDSAISSTDLKQNWTVGGNTLTYSISPALPVGLSMNTSTAVITGTPTAITADATYTLTGTDEYGRQTSDTLTLEIGDFPYSVSIGSGEVITGTELTATVSGLSGGETVTYQWKDDGVAISGATSSTYTAAIGTDGIADASAISVTCTVDAGPEFTSPSREIRYAVGAAPAIADGQTFTVDSAITPIDASASGANLTWTYALSGQPAGVSINSSTGSITGTPSAASSGTATITATDQYGRTVQDTFTFTASLRTQATGGVDLDLSFVEDSAITSTDLKANWTANGNTLTYAIVGTALPTGLSVSSAGVMTGTPTTPTADATYTLRGTDEYGRTTDDTFTLEITSAGGSFTSAYAANSIDPELVADFPNSFYATDSAADTFAGMFTFARASDATYVDSSGVLQTASSGAARTGHHKWDGSAWVNKGLLLESEARTNLLLNSGTLSTQNVTVSAVQHVLSFTGTGTVTLSGVSTAGPLVGTGTGEQNRVQLAFTPTAGTLTLTVSGTVTNAQLEEVTAAVPYASSYIATTGATVTRAAETLSIAAANLPIANSDTDLSIAVIGEVDYADDNNSNTIGIYQMFQALTREIVARVRTDSAGGTGGILLYRRQTTAGFIQEADLFTPGQNVPLKLASRYNSSELNGAISGTSLTALSNASTGFTTVPDFVIGADQNYTGTIDTIIIWAADIGDTGIEEASA